MDDTSGTKLTLPYQHALKAFAYSGITLNQALAVLADMKFLLPPMPNKALIKIYDKHRRLAKAINSEFMLPPHKISELGIDPFYSWAQSRDNPGICETTRYANKIVEEAKQKTLRKMVDILLFLRKPPEEIAQILYRASTAYKPILAWGEKEISDYKKFFWNIDAMSITDWQRYICWHYDEERVNELEYIAELLVKDTDDLLFDAGLPLAMDVDEMAEIMMRECYMRFRTAMKGSEIKEPDEGMAFNYLKAFRLLYGAKTRKPSSTAQERSDIQIAIERARDLMDNGQGVIQSIPLSEIQGKISDPSDIKEHPIVYDWNSIQKRKEAIK